MFLLCLPSTESLFLLSPRNRRTETLDLVLFSVFELNAEIGVRVPPLRVVVFDPRLGKDVEGDCVPEGRIVPLWRTVPRLARGSRRREDPLYDETLDGLLFGGVLWLAVLLKKGLPFLVLGFSDDLF